MKVIFLQTMGTIGHINDLSEYYRKVHFSLVLTFIKRFINKYQELWLWWKTIMEDLPSKLCIE